MNKATNSELMKSENEKLILRLIMKEKYSRADIARITKLTRAAVTIIVDNLKSKSIIKEEISDYSGVGRKPKILKINKNRYYTIGIDITRKSYNVGIVNLAGEIISSEENNLIDIKPEQVLNEIINIIKRLVKNSNIDENDILGIGVTAPGPIDHYNNIILTPPDFELWHNTDVNIIKNVFKRDIPLCLENIANATSLYEKYFGNCTDNPDYISLLVNYEGIGSGIIINNKLYRGPNGHGCEIGHISINIDGKKCKCGNTGCLECYASLDEIIKNTPYNSWREVMDNNDLSIIEKEIKYLSSALISVINMIDINTVVLSGDITYKSKIICDELNKNINKKIITKKEIAVISSLNNNPVSVSASIIIDNFFN